MGVPVSTAIIIIGIRVAMLMFVGRGRLISPIIEGLRGTVIILAWRGPCGSTNEVIPKSRWVFIIRWRLSQVHHRWGSDPNITSLRHTLSIIIIIIARRQNIIHTIRHTLGEMLIISVLASSYSSSAAPPIASTSTASSATTGTVALVFTVAREIGSGIRLSHRIFFMETNNKLVLHPYGATSSLVGIIGRGVGFFSSPEFILSAAKESLILVPNAVWPNLIVPGRHHLAGILTPAAC